jgi:hypothetical protein
MALRAIVKMSAVLPFIIVMAVVMEVLFNSLLLNSMLFNTVLFNTVLAINFVQLAMNSLLVLATRNSISSALMGCLIVMLVSTKFLVAIFMAVICQCCKREGQQTQAYY